MPYSTQDELKMVMRIKKRMRADSLAITDYVCMLKNCKRVWEEKTDGGSMELQRIGIGMKSRKRSPGQDLLMGRPGGKKSGKRGMGGMGLC
jgi:hypothetical protein